MDLSFNEADIKTLFNDKEYLEGTHLDILARHIFYRAPLEVRRQYHITHNWISAVLHYALIESGRTWDTVVDVAWRHIQSSSNTENTLIVPYHDRDHWSYFIVEDSWTLHIDSLQIHRGRETNNFLLLIHMAWALCRGVQVGSKAWEAWIRRSAMLLPTPMQSQGWECGLMACHGLWQYMILRGRNKRSGAAVLEPSRYVKWTGKQGRDWYTGVLYLETVAPHPDFEKPSFPSGPTPRDPAGDSDCWVIEEATGRRFQRKFPAHGIDKHLSHIDLSTFAVRADVDEKEVAAAAAARNEEQVSADVAMARALQAQVDAEEGVSEDTMVVDDKPTRTKRPGAEGSQQRPPKKILRRRPK